MVFAHKCVAPWVTAEYIPSSESGKHQPSCWVVEGEGWGVMTSIPLERNVYAISAPES